MLIKIFLRYSVIKYQVIYWLKLKNSIKIFQEVTEIDFFEKLHYFVFGIEKFKFRFRK